MIECQFSQTTAYPFESFYPLASGQSNSSRPAGNTSICRQVHGGSVRTRQGFLVPLTPTVAQWFRQLKQLAGASEWVLPARTERRRAMHDDTHMGRTTLWASFARAFDSGKIDIGRFTPHDTRSTAKGHMRNLGVSREISEIALNHKLKGMEGIYDVREEIPERRDAPGNGRRSSSNVRLGGNGTCCQLKSNAPVKSHVMLEQLHP